MNIRPFFMMFREKTRRSKATSVSLCRLDGSRVTRKFFEKMDTMFSQELGYERGTARPAFFIDNK